MYGQPEPCVIIAGAGVAGAALAGLLRDRGFGVIVLARCPSRRGAGTGTGPVIEALPEATTRLFAEVGLAGALASAGAVVVEGFDNSYKAGASRRLGGRWVHVDRIELARLCLTVARRRGVTMLPSAGLSTPVTKGDGVELDVAIGGQQARLRAFAAVDATGRAARWSRPISRAGTQTATLYRGPGSGEARPGRVVRTQDGWAYRLDHPEATTIGVVTGERAHATRGVLDPRVAARLGITNPDCYVPMVTRPAAIQWTDQPVAQARLAIGDAALAYSPLAGQGLRFAVASALSAAAVLTSWREATQGRVLAANYYRAFVASARTRHLTKLATLDGEVPTDSNTSQALHVDRRLRFIAPVKHTAMNAQGRIVAGAAVMCADGGLARWINGLDLLHLRDALAGDRTVGEATAALTATGLSPAAAVTILAWALRCGLIKDVTTDVMRPADNSGAQTESH
jgi:2-polyprenyl-6-methoxyphenol hydroxylase-like FAD-dependent oxidoreductase